MDKKMFLVLDYDPSRKNTLELKKDPSTFVLPENDEQFRTAINEDISLLMTAVKFLITAGHDKGLFDATQATNAIIKILNDDKEDNIGIKETNE